MERTCGNMQKDNKKKMIRRYDYKCINCKKIVEKEHDINTKQYYLCPDCGYNMKKIIGVPHVKFIGKGFYVNDNT